MGESGLFELVRKDAYSFPYKQIRPTLAPWLASRWAELEADRWNSDNLAVTMWSDKISKRFLVKDMPAHVWNWPRSRWGI
jgi:hypothetical protein